MKKLFAGPFVGEFGWELFCWQGVIRALAEQYEHTTIVCLPGHQMLYQDFADEILEYSPQNFEPDCYHNIKGVTKDYPLPKDLVESKDLYIGPNTSVTAYNAHLSRFSPAYEQKYVKYGVENFNTPKVDVIIHARNTNKHNTGYRNWDRQKWNQVVKYLSLKGLVVGSMGTISSSLHIENTIDLRGLPLNDITSYLHSSKYVMGPSSGPLHLGALCGTDVVVWSGTETNTNRYLIDWNPHKVNVYYDHTSWDPSIDTVIKLINKI